VVFLPAEEPADAAEDLRSAVSAAEEVADACWKLAGIAVTQQSGADSAHDVAGRLLGAVDALGVAMRTTARHLPNDGTRRSKGADRWQAADRALAVVFAELYHSVPEDHPAREWFTRCAVPEAPPRN
jgi:hypothetical protein